MNLGFRESCRQRDIDLRCLVNKEADEKILATPGMVPTFTHSIVYNQPKDDLFLFGINYHFAMSFGDELRDTMADALAPGDMVVLHTVTPTHVLGLARWLETAEPDDLRVRVVFRFPPNFRMSGAHAELNAAIYRFAFSLLARSGRDRVRLFADSDPLAACLSELTDMRMDVAPLPIAYFPTARQAPSPDAGPTFLYAGEARMEKGFHLLRDAFSRIAAETPSVRFIVQAANVDPAAVDWPDAVLTRTTFAPGTMEPPAFHAFLGSADAVLVPYDPREYTLRTSHIFAEAIGLGIPVITTAGSWMHREMTKLDREPGLAMAAFTADSLAQAMAVMASQLSDYKAAAATAAPQWRARENFENFVDVILGAEP